MADAWSANFAGITGVTVSCGSIFEETADAIVSPANSFGFMDGGIDLAYSQHFGWDLSKRLQKILRDEYHGELLVGEATIIHTLDEKIPWMISAPTMRIPMDVSDTVNSYLAFRAVLKAVLRHNKGWEQSSDRINSILCPGLGTAIGRMPPEACAHQMFAAYNSIILGNDIALNGLEDAVEIHYYLMKFQR